MSVLNKSVRGDMYIELRVETPVNLNKEQTAALRAFEKTLTGRSGTASGGKSTSPESDGFFAKAKELWDDLTD